MSTTDGFDPAAILAELAGNSHRIDGADHCPNEPGLYAIYGTADAVDALRAAAARIGSSSTVGDDVPSIDPALPLYVGKAHRLKGRDVRTHFAAGKTGSSTLRRTLAALLGTGEWAFQPRATAAPGTLAWRRATGHFRLGKEHEEQLTAWMTDHLELAWWLYPADASSPTLAEIEQRVIDRAQPPLNLTHSAHGFAKHARSARAGVVTELRAAAERDAARDRHVD